MTNVATLDSPQTRELVAPIREHLDELTTYAIHLVDDLDEAVSFVAAGVHHASRYPPAKTGADVRAALFRAVTRACHQHQRFPPAPRGISRLWHRPTTNFYAEVDANVSINTVKRALKTLPFEQRAVLLLRDLCELTYQQLSVALELSPETVARLLASARRAFGNVYSAIAI